jgi:hypothetical protein
MGFPGAELTWAPGNDNNSCKNMNRSADSLDHRTAVHYSPQSTAAGNDHGVTIRALQPLYREQEMTTPISSNPVRLSIDHQEHYSRGLAILGCLLLYGRIIALIPIFIVLYFVGIAAFIVGWVMQFAVLFTGKYPAGPHSFLTGYLRWTVRVQAWLFGLTDKYPTSMQP